MGIKPSAAGGAFERESRKRAELWPRDTIGLGGGERGGPNDMVMDLCRPTLSPLSLEAASANEPLPGPFWLCFCAAPRRK